MRALRTGSPSCWYCATATVKRSWPLSGAATAITAIAHRHDAAITFKIGEKSPPLFFLRRLTQFALQGKNAMTRLKILCVMLSVVLVQKLLIGFDGRGLLRKFIVTDRANKPGCGLGRFHFGQLVHRAYRRGIIF